MDIPIELFLGFIGVSIALAIFGFLRNPPIPATIVMGGMFILVIAVATTNIVMGSQIDNVVSTEATLNITSNTIIVPDYSYNVWNGIVARTIDGGGSNPRGVVEYLSNSSSSLIGVTIECIDVVLYDVGTTSGANPITIGIFDNAGNVVIEFGSKLANTLTTTPTWYSFCLEDTEYTLQTGQRIGIWYDFDTTNNGIATRYDNTNPFDGVITFRQSFVAGYISDTASDVTMRLYTNEEIPNNVEVNGIGGVYSYEDNLYEFTELPKVLFSLLGVIFMLTGALMVGVNRD